MKTFVDSIACAAIRQPSITLCGCSAITWRSLNAPGSDSSALTTRYFGLAPLRSISEALRPIGKPAPPRPRRFAACSSAIRSSGVIARAFATCAYRAPSGARSICLAPTYVLDDSGHVGGPDVVAVAMVDRDDGRVPAAAEALDRA